MVETSLDSVFRVFPLRGWPCLIGLGFLFHDHMTMAASTTRSAGYPMCIVRGNNAGLVVIACPSAERWQTLGTGSDCLQAGTLRYLRSAEDGLLLLLLANPTPETNTITPIFKSVCNLARIRHYQSLLHSFRMNNYLFVLSNKYTWFSVDSVF